MNDIDMPFGIFPEPIQQFPKIRFKTGRSATQPVVRNGPEDTLLPAQPADAHLLEGRRCCARLQSCKVALELNMKSSEDSFEPCFVADAEFIERTLNGLRYVGNRLVR